MVITAKPDDGKLNQLQDLAGPGLKLVLADKAVPVGKYSLEFLDNASKLPEFGSSFNNDSELLRNAQSHRRAVRESQALSQTDCVVLGQSKLAGNPPIAAGDFICQQIAVPEWH